MENLNATILASRSGQNGQNYFNRPKKRGNPSHADWNKFAGIIKDSIGSLPLNANFDEIRQIVEELARFNGISLPKWAVNYFTNQILGLCCCLNYLSLLNISNNSDLLHCPELTEDESLQLLFDQDLTKSQLIDLLLSHVSLVKKICDNVKH